MKLLRYWWPTALWAAAIFFFSTDYFSSEHTSRFIFPILAWLFPRADFEFLLLAHFYIRKSAHVMEYLILSLLLLHGIRQGRSGWRMGWAVAAVGVAAGWAALDELHQAFVPSRGPSMYDVLLDTAGAAVAQILGALWAWRESRVTSTE